MMDIWVNMGFIRYPVTFAGIAVLALSMYSATRVFGWNARADLVTKAWIDSVFFWGGFAMISGMLGTLVGWVITAESVVRAGDIAPTLVWGGFQVSLFSSVFGTLLLCVAALSWFVLQFRWRVLQADAVDEAE